MKIQVLSRPNGIKISNLPKSGKQKLPKKVLEMHKAHLTQTDESITFHTLEGDVVFHVDHAPGRYCMTCNEEMPDARADPFNKAVKAHVKSHDNAKASERWPHGYMVATAHECTIEDQRNG